MDMGDRIRRAWQSFVRHEISGKALRKIVDEIEWGDDHRFDAYFYVVIGKHDGEPTIDGFEGPMAPDFFLGANPSQLVVAIPVHAGMTKRDLLHVDFVEESSFWDHPDWADG